MMGRISLCLFYALFPTVFAGEELWVASIRGGWFESQLLASRYGYTIVKKLELDENLYVLKRDNRISINKRSHEIYRSEKVNWMERQKPLIRRKRGIYSWLRSKYGREFNDDLWNKEWYLQDYRSRTTLPVLDMNVVPCYREGVTGKGVNVVVVDDGLEKDHMDLKENFNPLTSYDFNEDKPDPTPRYDGFGSNSHGTKCAGEIAMVANNKICGVGIAYNSSIGGLKILDGNPTDLIESSALTYALDKVDVYSNSWGPSDDGMTMERPGQLLELGFEAGINKGRNGKGAIYIFASGNGKTYGDNCAADGYILSIYTVPIASASQRGKTVSYGERCSAIMATAYSSGGNRDEKVATTNINNTCTVRHSGTSAAAPLAAGIAALVLQANPNITWRDFQHLVVWTSEVSPLSGNNGWMVNGFDFWYSMDFGFGLLNAHSMVQHARTFTTVPPKKICVIPIRIYGDKTLKKGSVLNVKVATKSCQGESMEINFLEHVQLITTIRYPKRGSISVLLTSPSGTQSTLLEERFRDLATSGLVRWSLMSVHFWGENPRGIWTVTIKTNPDDDEEFVEMKGSVRSLRLVFHGTKTMPDHYRKGPRRYATFAMYPRGPKYFSKYT